MRILIIGSGGREHAIADKIYKQNNNIEIFAAPGNGGISQIAECVDIKPTEFEKLIDFTKTNKIDFTIVGMDEPLVLGIVDEFLKNNLKIFGPTKKAAQLEGSKSFSKALMKKYHIPTANYEIFDDYNSAAEYDVKFPAVVKADGLALGKGVVICENKEEYLNALKDSMLNKKFGESGNRVVIEEFLVGDEVSVLAFCDGKNIIPMVSAKDHKKIFDGDKGLNTGGMGAISPARQYSTEIAEIAMRDIYQKTLFALNAEGIIYKGIIFFGLIITADGPKVIEYNARFGDPETQAVLPRLKTNLLDILIACTLGNLDKIEMQWENNAAACVMLASNGYPEKYQMGFKIDGIGNLADKQNILVYHSGTKLMGNEFYTNGGRVLGITAIAENLDEAIRICYDNIKEINFENMYYRKDIGKI